MESPVSKRESSRASRLTNASFSLITLLMTVWLTGITSPSGFSWRYLTIRASRGSFELDRSIATPRSAEGSAPNIKSVPILKISSAFFAYLNLSLNWYRSSSRLWASSACSALISFPSLFGSRNVWAAVSALLATISGKWISSSWKRTAFSLDV